jgi:hypothetical protein
MKKFLTLLLSLCFVGALTFATACEDGAKVEFDVSGTINIQKPSSEDSSSSSKDDEEENSSSSSSDKEEEKEEEKEEQKPSEDSEEKNWTKFY